MGPTANNAEDGSAAPAAGVAVGEAKYFDGCNANEAFAFDLSGAFSTDPGSNCATGASVCSAGATGGDGDPDQGIGGDFFPSGDCVQAPAVAHHSPASIDVASALPLIHVYFVVAGNDVDTGSCVSDGIISPGEDAHDWFEVCEDHCAIPGFFGPQDALAGCTLAGPPTAAPEQYDYGGAAPPSGGGGTTDPNASCSALPEVAGADGGFYVFVDPGIVAEFDESAAEASTPTSGVIFTS